MLCYPATSCPLSLLHEVDWKRAKLVFAVLYCRLVSIAIIARIYIYIHIYTAKLHIYKYMVFPNSSVGKDSACNLGDPGLIPGSGTSAGEPIAFSCTYLLLFQMVKKS